MSETIILAFTVEKTPTNEVEDWTPDPDDLREFLESRFLGEGSAYNKHAGQQVTAVSVFRPRVIVWHAKHGDVEYPAHTDELLQESSRKIIKTLIQDGWIQEPNALEDTWGYDRFDFELLSLTDEQADALPTQSMKDAVAKERKSYASFMREWELEKAEYADAVALAEGRDLEHTTPWGFLQGRSGYEYEVYELKYVAI